jgi:hypothetical protein
LTTFPFRTPGPGRGNKTQSSETTAFSDGPSTLAELGISKNQSSQWQKLAEVQDAVFEEALDHQRKSGAVFE